MKTNITNNSKYKIVFDLIGMQTFTSIKGIIVICENSLLIKIPNCAKTQSMVNFNQIDIIYRNIKPLYMTSEDSFLLSYGLIKACRQYEKQLKLEIFNPSYKKILTIIITYIEV